MFHQANVVPTSTPLGEMSLLEYWYEVVLEKMALYLNLQGDDPFPVKVCTVVYVRGSRPSLGKWDFVAGRVSHTFDGVAKPSMDGCPMGCSKTDHGRSMGRPWEMPMDKSMGSPWLALRGQFMSCP